MKPKHTPGPWHLDSYNDDTGCYQIGSAKSNLILAHVIDYGEAGTDDCDELQIEAASNAVLISAAPDMLNALKALAYGKHVNASNPNIVAARKAIEKATEKPE